MLSFAIGIVKLALFLVAFFWVLGAIWIMPSIRGDPPTRTDNVRFTLAFGSWIFSGYALFRWVIPPAINPFFDPTFLPL